MATPNDNRELEQAREPLFLIDSRLNILWENEAARLIKERFGRSRPGGVLSELCSGLTREQVLHTHGTGSFPVTIFAKPAGNLGQPGSTRSYHAVLLEVSGAEPDKVRHLVSLQSAPPVPTRSANSPESFATIAHDLKNPLSAIFGYADALLDSPSGTNLGERECSIISRIRSTAARSIEMVRNYQQLSEIESGSVSRRRVKSDLNMLVSAVIENTWREDASAPELKLRLHAEALPIAIESIQLERVLANLFINALRYTPPNGTISIETQRQDGEAVFSIHNSGSYIPAEEVPKIFGRYQRGSTSKGIVGTGLGLYIVQQLVSNIGGSVQCQSSKEKGTVFTVRFPIAES